MIELSAGMKQDMLEHALREFPNEACGLLAGSTMNGEAGDGAPVVTAEHFYPMVNADASPVTYRLDPSEQLKVFNEVDRLGLELVGIFHSHTHSDAVPSETDRKQAFYPDAHYLLVSLSDRSNPVLRGYTIRDGEVREQEVSIR
jgi:[CysO sulfur-carrier protein]-S-L-cysteine hydrolase